MSLISEEFLDHMRASLREQLLAWRSILDLAVRAIDEREERVRARREGAREESQAGFSQD